MPLAISTSTDVVLLLLSLTLWTTVYYHATLSPSNPSANLHGFVKSIFISNLHCIPLVLLSLASLFEFIPEKYPIFYSVGFFIADVVDCVRRGDVVFFIHAGLTLGMKLGASSSVVHMGLRSSSKGYLAEASTPFLNHWRATKSENDFRIFFLVFTVTRIIWVPYFIHQTYTVHLKERDFLFWPCMAFILLQLTWFAKMVNMVLNYKVSLEDHEQEQSDDHGGNKTKGSTGKGSRSKKED